MKAKKLTKREWYLGAQMYYSHTRLDFGHFDIGDLHERIVEEVKKYISADCYMRIEPPDRWSMFSQLCLEHAGIPAGDR